MFLHSVPFALVLLLALSLFVWNVRRLITYLKTGKNENRCDDVGKRLSNVLKIVFGQTKLLREPFAGTLHLLIFWGFVVLLAAVMESVGEGLFPGFSFAF